MDTTTLSSIIYGFTQILLSLALCNHCGAAGYVLYPLFSGWRPASPVLLSDVLFWSQISTQQPNLTQILIVNLYGCHSQGRKTGRKTQIML